MPNITRKNVVLLALIAVVTPVVLTLVAAWHFAAPTPSPSAGKEESASQPPPREPAARHLAPRPGISASLNAAMAYLGTASWPVGGPGYIPGYAFDPAAIRSLHGFSIIEQSRWPCVLTTEGVSEDISAGIAASSGNDLASRMQFTLTHTDGRVMFVEIVVAAGFEGPLYCMVNKTDRLTSTVRGPLWNFFTSGVPTGVGTMSISTTGTVGFYRNNVFVWVDTQGADTDVVAVAREIDAALVDIGTVTNIEFGAASPAVTCRFQRTALFVTDNTLRPIADDGLDETDITVSASDPAGLPTWLTIDAGRHNLSSGEGDGPVFTGHMQARATGTTTVRMYAVNAKGLLGRCSQDVVGTARGP